MRRISSFRFLDQANFKALRSVVPIFLAATALSLLLDSRTDVSAQISSNGPPQFVTLPLPVMGMVGAELQNGRIIYTPPRTAERLDSTGKPVAGGAPGGVAGKPSGGGTTGSDFGGTGAFAVSTLGACTGSTPDVDVTCAPDSYQGEPALGFDDVAHVLIGAQNDIYPGGCSANAASGGAGDCGLSVSMSSTGVLPGAFSRVKLSRAWGGHNFVIGFDPSVAVSNGVYYVAYGVADGGVNSANAIAVVHGSSSGWLKSNPVALNLSGSVFDDKYWIAADANVAGQIYVAWDRNQSNNQILYVAASSDSGQHWSAPVKVNDGTSKFERVWYAFPAVAPTGDVFVLWHDYARRRIYIDRSTTHGKTWGTDRVVATTSMGATVDIGCNGGRGMAVAPQMAIVDHAGSVDGYDIYVTYADYVSNAMKVFVTRSSDRGITWSTPVRVSQNVTDWQGNTVNSNPHQYNPAVTATGSTVSVSYLDRRNDAGNCSTDTYLSQFASGAALASSPSDTRVSTASSNFDGNRNGPGDYQGGTAGLGSTYAYFSDHRTDNASSGSGGGFEIYISQFGAP